METKELELRTQIRELRQKLFETEQKLLSLDVSTPTAAAEPTVEQFMAFLALERQS